MRHSLPLLPQFYVTAPQPCPYLDGRMERKLFTALQGPRAMQLHDALSRQGFRRSQNVLYRPSCVECAACYSARIRVADFRPSRSQRRVLKKNRDMRREASTPWATEEQYALFRAYLEARHADGGMADMDIFEFAAMVEETPVRTRVIEYFRPAAPDARTIEGISTRPDGTRLSAVCLTDVMEDGLSMVYSFFDPATQHLSPGSYIILDHVEIAREAGLPYVYLGYWVPDSPKMGYKAQYGALEIYAEGRWQPLDDPERWARAARGRRLPPIPEQVADIALPGMERADPG